MWPRAFPHWNFRLIALLFLLMASFALRIAYCHATTGLGGSLGRHYREYLIQGRRFIELGTLVSPFILERVPTEPSALLPPGYTLVVAAVFGIFGVETTASFFVLQLVNALATTLVVWFVFLTAERLGGRYAAWVAALIAALHPALIGFTTYFWDTSLLALGVSMTIYLAVTLRDSKESVSSWCLYGLFLGLVAMVNPSLTAAYPFLVLWPITKRFGFRPRPMLSYVPVVIAGWVVALAPWTIRNYLHFGEWFYVRNGFAHELWIGVCPEADTDPPEAFFGRFPLLNAQAQRRISEIGETAYIQECAASAKAAIRADPLRYLRLTAVRAVDYWAGTVFSRARAESPGVPRNWPHRAICVLLVLESCVLLVCLFRRIGGSGELRWPALTALTFSIVYCLTHVQVRFRTPIEPILILWTLAVFDP